MKRIIKWFIGLMLVSVLGYAGWMAYHNGVLPESIPTTSSSVQVVKLAKSTVESTISATGSIRTNQSAQVTWQAGGKVGTINVIVGDQVKADDVLAVLDPAFLPTTILTAKQNLATAQAALLALTDNQTSLYQAQKDVIDAQTAVDKAQNHRDMMNSDTRGTTQQIADATAMYLMTQENVKRLRDLYERLPGDPATELHNKAPALLNLEKAKTARDTALATLNWYSAKWSASDIAAADKALALAKATLADAQDAMAKIQNGPEPSELTSAQLRIADDQAIINSQNITSPISGTVTNVSAMVGDIVSTGTTSFRIDDTSAYFVDLGVSEVDVASVQTGQVATLMFDAISDKTYQGVVTEIGQVGTTTNGVVNFKVTVQITGADSAIKPGMTAAASIVVSSAENVLVVPGKAIKTVGSQKVVYLLNGVSVATSGTTGATQNQATVASITLSSGDKTTLTPVSVEVGLSSDTNVQITSNRLQVGDLIAINPSVDQLAGLAKTTTN